MHQLCGLAPLEGGWGVGVAISVEFCSVSGGLILSYFGLLWI